MNINTLIELSMIFAIIVFLISIVLIIYYLIKGKLLIEPVQISDKSYKLSKKYKNATKTLQNNRLPFLGEGIVLKSQNMPKNITIEMDTDENLKNTKLLEIIEKYKTLESKLDKAKIIAKTEHIRLEIYKKLEPKPVKMKNIPKTKHISEFSFNEGVTI
jgi:hypothetical protein